MTIQQQPRTFAGDDTPTQAFALPRQRHAASRQAPPALPTPPAPRTPQAPPAPQGMPTWQDEQPSHRRAAQPARSNGLATSGFVVALIGAVFSIIPFIGTVAWVIAPVGLVLSVVGLALYRSRRTGRGLAIAGVLLAIFALIMCIVYTASFVGAVNSATAPAAGTPASGTASGAAPAASSAVQQAGGRYGARLVADDLTVTASAPKKVSSVIGSQLCSTVTYRNTGAAPASYNPFDWKFRTASGADSSASIPFNTGNALNSGDLQPGGTVSGSVCADDTVKTASAVVYSPGLGVEHQLTWQ